MGHPNGEAKIEHIEAEETCTMPSMNFYSAAFEWKSCMHFCENLGGSRVPSVTSIRQWEKVRSFAAAGDKNISQFWSWLPIHDKETEGEWRDFYNHHALNFTLPWLENEPNGGETENCAASQQRRKNPKLSG